LLGDGDALDSGYESLVKRIHATGVTVSTVATNADTTQSYRLMQNIARWGGGRYYRADDPTSIPKIFVREAHLVAGSGIVEGKFYPQRASTNPMLRDLHTIPPLTGYVVTAPKTTGEQVLVSRRLDPILSAWQFGLGRAVAWTSDASGFWTHDWLLAPGANRFWADVVSWTLPSTGSGGLFVATTSVQGRGRISVITPPKLGVDPQVTARVIGPNVNVTEIRLQPLAPGHYLGSFPMEAPGSYFVEVEGHGSGHAAIGQAGLDLQYSPEYSSSGTDMGFLRQLARAGGGRLVGSPASVWSDNLAAVVDNRSLTQLFWVLALLLLPIDVGVRRLVISRRDLAALRSAGLAPQGKAARKPSRASPLAALGSRVSLFIRALRRAQREPAAAPPASVPGHPAGRRDRGPAGGGSTAGKLLEAKRRRRQMQQ
jgi:hypothetical protein